MRIGSHQTENRTFIIAEIGNNHEGKVDVARELILRAKEAGVDAVKFQTFIPELFVNSADIARLERLRGFQLRQTEFVALYEEAKRNDLYFISTPLDLQSAEFLNTIVDAFKIASGDNNFYALIQRVAEFGKPMIVSGGLAEIRQLQLTKDFIEKIWKDRCIVSELAFLHCVTSYPVPSEQANLGGISDLIKNLRGTIGYSDHTLGIEACILSVALGAQIIEKHFTLDKNYSSFRDHQLSADPKELQTLVKSIRRTEQIIGPAKRSIQECEKEFQVVARRSAAALYELEAGQPLRTDSILWVRPATGIPPGQEREFVGRKLKRSIKIGEIINPEDFI